MRHLTFEARYNFITSLCGDPAFSVEVRFVRLVKGNERELLGTKHFIFIFSTSGSSFSATPLFSKPRFLKGESLHKQKMSVAIYPYCRDATVRSKYYFPWQVVILSVLLFFIHTPGHRGDYENTLLQHSDMRSGCFLNLPIILAEQKVGDILHCCVSS